MKSGTFTPGEEKVRAGIYFHLTEKASDRLTVGERGRVAIPLVLPWGDSGKLINIKSEGDASEKLGISISDDSLLLVREVRKNAAETLVYRVNEGVKAEGAAGETLTLEAKYGGAKGNELSVRISANVLDETKKEVTTFLGTEEVESQTVETAEDLVDNKYLTFTGTGELEDVASAKLTGGTDGTALVDAYTKFFEALEVESFDVVAFPVDDEALKVSFASFIKRIREDQGVKVQGVTSGLAANYEGIINVTNGPVLENGTTLSASEAVAWVAGASAGATLQQSLTFMIYGGAVDVEPRFDHDETIERLKKGEFLFSFDGRDKTVTVESDQNSLESTAKMSQNKVVRITDAFQNDVFRSLKDIIRNRKSTGVDIPVNEDGQSIVHTAVTLYMKTLQDNGIIKNFDPSADVEVSITAAGSGFLIKYGIQPVQSAEKFYFDGEVS